MMKQDPIMKWIHNSRTIITKQGDLEINSTVLTTVCTYEKRVVFSLKCDSFSTTRETIKKVFLANLPPTIKSMFKNGLLRIERNWVTKDFPDKNVFSLLFYGYKFLLTMVVDLHSKMALDFYMCEHTIWNDIIFDNFEEEDFQEYKEIWVDLESNKILKRYTPITTNKNNIKNKQRQLGLDKRYPKIKELNEKYKLQNMGINFPFNHLDFDLEISKYFMRIDGGLAPKISFFKDNAIVDSWILDAQNKKEKYLLWHKIADFVLEKHITAINVQTECWLINKDDEEEYLSGLPTSHRKKEQIIVMAVTPEKTIIRSVLFRKNLFRKFVFGKETKVEIYKKDIRTQASILLPVYEAWDGRKF